MWEKDADRNISETALSGEKIMTRIILTFLGLMIISQPLFSQEAATEITESDIQTVLDPSPFLSARASGLGGAMSTLSDGTEAVYYNPAGIGGLHIGSKKTKDLSRASFSLRWSCSQ